MVDHLCHVLIPPEHRIDPEITDLALLIVVVPAPGHLTVAGGCQVLTVVADHVHQTAGEHVLLKAGDALVVALLITVADHALTHQIIDVIIQYRIID